MDTEKQSAPRRNSIVFRDGGQRVQDTVENKKHRIGVRSKLTICLAVFTAVFLLVLWISQTVFLADIYRNTKQRQITSTAAQIHESVLSGNLLTEDTVSALSRDNQLCIQVLTSSFSPVYTEANSVCYSRGSSVSCFVHQLQTKQDTFGSFEEPYESLFSENFSGRLSRFVQIQFLASVRQSGEVYFEDIRKETRGDRTVQGETGLVQSGGDSVSSMLYVEFAGISDTEQTEDTADTENSETAEDVTDGYYIIINSQITPVAATVQTLRMELIIISIVFVIAAILMALFLSSSISTPIVNVNASALQLATGDYSTQFHGDGYREIAELSDTLNYAATELSKVEGFRRELLANISHDLRTPLTMISGYAEVMRDIPGENTPENVQVIIDEAGRLTTLVNDLLDLSKLQAGTATLTLTEFSLTDCIDSIISRYQKLKESDGYHIDFLCEPDEDVPVRADASKLQQVIYNLVNNAISYTGEDKTVHIRQTTRTENGKQLVRISVTDTGMGISEDNLEYIWDRYFKENKAHKRAVIGTGLGLSIVKEVLKLHHASFGVDTSEDPRDHGSTFWFEMETANTDTKSR